MNVGRFVIAAVCHTIVGAVVACAVFGAVTGLLMLATLIQQGVGSLIAG